MIESIDIMTTFLLIVLFNAIYSYMIFFAPEVYKAFNNCQWAKLSRFDLLSTLGMLLVATGTAAYVYYTAFFLTLGVTLVWCFGLSYFVKPYRDLVGDIFYGGADNVNCVGLPKSLKLAVQRKIAEQTL